MPRLHSELARETIAYTAGFLVLHFVCRTLSHYASPTFRRCSPSDKAYWAASMVSTVNALGNAYWWREWSGVEATTVHHVIGMVAYWRVLTGGFCHFHALCGWLLEATTPFALRILLFGWALSQRASEQVAELDAPNAAIMYFAFAGGYLLQWFWGYKLLRGLLKALGVVGKSGTRDAKAL
ncbi:hypothetical protein EMIHUDRAFT_216558 [Emiliania huxleyi CCMP1516]|uniref:TLC domain-containing protein n=2 Tax=Emiliania huxleyi TaxID=2903 RepID=A0A0D3ID83_EMIH1|nr:hypothetical protein EMIHUDRAFT_216558 [Emiliania huxleyi CCMP1516]EOD09218.1 hypothetical protein EMIHUDRAFT_216558 [Emiliania huxleyi CCMP1516]|eukprot:XP_005761647.1 hypothetical protein EMIHUDRAFT_216558 [Emiliania huxleyi CCMP1516]